MKYKVLCDRVMDGDEIIEMLMSIHKLLSSVYDFSPSISLSKEFRVIRIEVDGEFYFFNVSDGERGGSMMELEDLAYTRLRLIQGDDNEV